jgi:Arc/MetJ-type ribon-helix-helix transcriptional regulator
MPNAAKIVLPADLQAFAEEHVRTGKSASVDDFVREVLEEKKRALLRDAIDDGIVELDAGLGVETSPEELMAEVCVEAAVTR